MHLCLDVLTKLLDNTGADSRKRRVRYHREYPRKKRKDEGCKKNEDNSINLVDCKSSQREGGCTCIKPFLVLDAFKEDGSCITHDTGCEYGENSSYYCGNNSKSKTPFEFSKVGGKTTKRS